MRSVRAFGKGARGRFASRSLAGKHSRSCQRGFAAITGLNSQSEQRSGFSLAEVVIGSGVLAMFMLAMPLAIRIAGRAVPDGQNTASAAMYASRAIELLTSDVTFATSITSKSSTSLAFTVPDRNGDGVPEAIQYSWTPPAAGQPAASLVRQYNGQSAIIVDNVQEFSLLYDTRSVSSPATTTGTEALLFSVNSGSGYGIDGISSNNWEGEFFQPQLPANALSWNLTRVVLNIEAGQVVDQASVQIWKAAGQYPDTIILGTSSVNASTSLSSITSVSFPFTNLTNLSPSSNLFAVITSSDANSSCKVQRCGRSNGQGGLVKCNGTGTQWSNDNGHDLCLSVYGTINSPGTPTTNYFLTDVRCTLRTNANTGSRITTSVRTINQPQVSGP